MYRIWTYGLAALGDHVDLSVVDLHRRWSRGRRVDVWLTDGHQGPIQTRAPVVAHFHEASWDDPETGELLDPGFVARYRKRSEAAAQQATRIITGSEHSRREIVDTYGLPSDRVHVVFDGVDLDIHRTGLTGGAELVRRANGSDAPYILFVGTVHPRKNLPVLREAVDRLSGEGLPHHLVLVSSPAPDRSDSRNLLAQAEAPIAGRAVVNLAGLSDEDLAAVIADADVLCLPSLHEGFGLPVVEAMACGTPVVVSNRGSLPQVVGDAGIVTEPTVDAIAAGIRDIATDPARAAELRARGVERAADFSWARMAREWAAVLRLAAEA